MAKKKKSVKKTVTRTSKAHKPKPRKKPTTMAKKKHKKRSKKRSHRIGSDNSQLFNFDKLIGFAGARFANQKLLPKVDFLTKLDPKIQGAAKIFVGEWAPKQSFAAGLGSADMRRAVGDGLIYEGVSQLMTSLGVAGDHNTSRKARGNEMLAVAIEGLEDNETVSADVLADDKLDVDTVNDDVLGDDDDRVNDDYEIGADDLDAVNDDELGEDDL